MKVYSWNVYCYNRKLPEVCAYIKKLDFDVLCLQEVSLELLTELKKLPCHISYHVDVLRIISEKKKQVDYVVILSRHEILGQGTLQFPELPFPWHTQVFIRSMSIFKWFWVAERGIVYADIQIQEQVVRIYSIHLTLSGPGNRAKEFALLMENIPKEHGSIICGDFNVVEYAPMKLISWLLGSPIQQGMPWYPERRLFEERFAQHGFYNPLLKQTTHRFSRSQLDHILVPKEIPTTRAWVEKDAHGSDHQPVGVELQLR
jgi:endonuclease/exonuclease/phosphatase family metal-dependent hydrolase